MILDFLKDRLLYILVYFISISLSILVIQLDWLQSGNALGFSNILYIYILSLAVLIIYLAISYLNQMPFYRELKRARADESLERVIGLQSALTKEQLHFQELAQSTYQSFREELVRYQKQQEQHLTFINQWVHHMKTPVSVIDLLTQKGHESVHDEEAQELFQSIREETVRLTKGLEMALHLARLGKFETDLSPKEVDLAGVVRDCINTYKRTMIHHSIFPKLECNSGEAWIYTDPKWLHFVISQLTSNAIKYSAKGANQSIVYHIVLDHDSYKLSVRDYGMRIPKEDLPRVFDAFFTGENGRRGTESTGMGLYLVKEVCKKLGHPVTIESEPGKGTCVTIKFPSETLHKDVLGW
ncbi:sensor histidine kinase [Pullulanibacillus sp. KACC 23026]|uniref:sensor histidine kinase n=1 Tax=Pullulanibacillus sp. KACC 23026 TaxID=3028315 RepID=UPI0023B0F154|nr:sensor histidine kinase [Pullulanibacillus sp. KACC 23026]WEG11839.1 sensor histidine kinase [Pullulanibacillus sp. KACC 23026]